MSKINSEEKSPLLFVVDDEIPLRSGYFEGRRFNSITTGATTVLTHFPNYIGTCWIATAVSALVFFMMILLVLSTITAASIRVPRCAAFPEPNNGTIHLVHLHNLHHPETQSIHLIKDILGSYPTYNVRVLGVLEKQNHSNKIVPRGTEKNIKENTSSTEIISKSTTKREKILKRRKDIEEAQVLLNMLLHARLVDITGPIKTTSKPASTTKNPTDTIENLVDQFPKLTYENITYVKAFSESPLNPHYLIMNDRLRMFALRVLQIWQYGGISFDIETPSLDLKELTLNQPGKSRNFVIPEKEQYENNFKDIVVVDEKGLRLESKVPCHAFFGQVLTVLRKADKHTTVEDVMRKSIKTFCRHYVPHLEYCKMFVTV